MFARTVALFLILSSCCTADTKMSVALGPVNGVLIETDGKRLSVYGWDKDKSADIDYVLLAHGRRDVVRKSRDAAAAGAQIIAPNKERYGLESPAEFWAGFAQSRFHDYAQQSTKVCAEAVSVSRWVNEGDVIEWQGTSFQVVETPGYTRGSVSYIAEIEGKKTAFTGDLIYGNGQVFDLYSFQDAIPEAQVRGYHGYGSRLADLVSSLKKIAALKPDRIVPARGPVIENPSQSVALLISRVQTLYRNYLSTNALHWYFKEDRMRICGERVLGKGADIELMPYSRHEKTPSWIYENSTSRLLISDSGHGFLLDCGNKRVIDAINDLIEQDVIKKVEGIFVTHYHDDHTDAVQAAAEAFQCPVYATKEYADVLEFPEGYHLPAMTANAVKNVTVVDNGHTMKWRDFELTFHFFPGQTWYHGALFARKGNQKPVFFIGDAFAPSGLDDYCVLNRNLVHDDSGYLLCLKKLRSVKEPFWLVNEHIPYVFSFSDAELDYLEQRYRERIAVLKELFPWDDPNYGIDEQWAVMYPRGITVASDRQIVLEVRLENHSPRERTFEVTPQLPKGFTISGSPQPLKLQPREKGKVRLPLNVTASAGTHLITADIAAGDMQFREWVEAAVTVK